MAFNKFNYKLVSNQNIMVLNNFNNFITKNQSCATKKKRGLSIQWRMLA